MFIASAANDTLQGRAIHKINELWGADFRSWNGRETIGIPVCKKKYAPFNFRMVTEENGLKKVKVVRMYGCVCHSHLRQNIIRKEGPRKGWEPFGQWSMKKAVGIAKRFAQKINQERQDENACIICSSSSDEEREPSSPPSTTMALKNLCQNGQCAWKVRDKFDDINAEIFEADKARRKLIVNGMS